MIMPRASRRKATVGTVIKEVKVSTASPSAKAKNPLDETIQKDRSKARSALAESESRLNSDLKAQAKAKAKATSRLTRKSPVKAAASKLPTRSKPTPLSPAMAVSDSSPSVKAAQGRKKAASPKSSPQSKTKLNTSKASTLVVTTNDALVTPVQLRKRSIQATLHPSTTTSTSIDLIEELRQNFQQLTMLRTTAAEALLEEYKKTSEERITAAERVIESLKRENEALKKSCEAAIVPRTPSRLSDVSTLATERTDLVRPLLDLYENLSGLRVSADLDQPRLWHCSIAGRQGEFAFDLTLDEEDAQCRYTPHFSSKSPIAARLPGYLQEEIVFDVDQLQLFFWRALNFLMSLPK